MNKTIHPNQRIWWDAFVFLVIIWSAFEIPFDMLVGWGTGYVEVGFDAIFLLVFGTDIVLNCMTVREPTHGGLWGWRHLGGYFRYEWSVEHQRIHYSGPPLLQERPGITRDYLRSGWFVIDFVSTIPWGFLAPITGSSQLKLLTNLRMLRLLRLARLFKILQQSNARAFFDKIRRAAPDVPSVERLFFTTLSVPWFMHVHACLFYYFQHGRRPEGWQLSPELWPAFHEPLYGMFIAVATGEVADQVDWGQSTPSQWVVISAVVISVFVLANVTGNLAALYTNLDFGGDEGINVNASHHSVILGWNNTIFAVISQLASDDEFGEPADIYILSEREPEAVYRDVLQAGVEVETGRVHAFQGSISAITNLRAMALDRARQVIILGQDAQVDGPSSDPIADELADAEVLKAVLACGHATQAAPQRSGRDRRRRASLPVVASVRSELTAATMRAGIPEGFHGGRISLEVVETSDVLARCLAQTINQPALAGVMMQLFSYTTKQDEGARRSTEIYTVATPKPALGQRYQDILFAFERAIPIGVIAEGKLWLNPALGSPMALRPLRAEDRLVVTARERSEIVMSTVSPPDYPTGFKSAKTTLPPRKILVIGRGRKTEQVLKLVPEFLPIGSEIISDVADEPIVRAGVTIRPVGAAGLTRDDHGALRTVDLIRNAPSDIVDVDTVAVIADQHAGATHDATVLMSLAALQARAGKERRKRATVIELADPQNKVLARAFGDLSAIISAELVSNVLVQLAADPHRGAVYRELLDPRGNEIYMRPGSRYYERADDRPTFDQLQLRARVLGEAAIGYSCAEQGLVLCPTIEERAEPLDMDGLELVVIAEDDLSREG